MPIAEARSNTTTRQDSDLRGTGPTTNETNLPNCNYAQHPQSAAATCYLPWPARTVHVCRVMPASRDNLIRHETNGTGGVMIIVSNQGFNDRGQPLLSSPIGFAYLHGERPSPNIRSPTGDATYDINLSLQDDVLRAPPSRSQSRQNIPVTPPTGDQ